MSVSSLQGELDGALGGVRSHADDLRSSVELQQQYERLVHSLQELLALGSERLTQQPDSELHSRAQLQQQLSSHTVRQEIQLTVICDACNQENNILIMIFSSYC